VRSGTFAQALRHAWAGLIYALATQWNMRVHVVVGFFVLLAAYRLHLGRPALLALVLVIALVIALELVNTALEAAVDLLSPAEHPLAKAAKDCSAAAVLVAALAAVAVGVLAFTGP
jgi:undecaprenol kinase